MLRPVTLAIAAMGFFAACILGCGSGTGSTQTSQGGAGGESAGGSNSGGSGGQGGSSTSAGGSSQGGGSASGADCKQCMTPQPASQCATYDQDCKADESVGGCKSWSMCVEACLDNDFSQSCFDACDMANPGAFNLSTPVVQCACMACPAVCSPLCI